MDTTIRNDTRGTEEATALLGVATVVASEATGKEDHAPFVVVSIAVQAITRAVVRHAAESLGVQPSEMTSAARAAIANEIMRGLSMGVVGSQALMDPQGDSDEALITAISADIRHETPRLRTAMFAHVAKESGGLH